MVALVGKEDNKGIQAAMGSVQSLGMDRGPGLYRKKRINEYGLGMPGGNVIREKACVDVRGRGDSGMFIGQ